MYDILTGRSDRHLILLQDRFYIHKKMKKAFILMKAHAQQAGFDLALVSSFRSYERQKMIWEKKALGERPLFNNEDQALNYKSLTEKEKLFWIMRWSAIPGASRHHWGTDIDVFDQRVCSLQEVSLQSFEVNKGGIFYEFHQWLDEYLLSPQNPGFFRPYNTDRKGVAIEKWHLSYFPLSDFFLKKYTFDIFKKNLNHSPIHFQNLLLKNAPEFYDQYLINIDQNPQV